MVSKGMQILFQFFQSVSCLLWQT